MADHSSKQRTRKKIVNADNKHLHAWGGQGIVIGYVDEVNGEGAAELSAFNPTRHELLRLADYWERVALDLEYFWFETGQVGSDDARRRSFARRRVARIATVIGAEPVDSVIEAVWDEFGKSCDPEHWNLFLHGDDAARAKVQREISAVGPDDEQDDHRE